MYFFFFFFLARSCDRVNRCTSNPEFPDSPNNGFVICVQVMLRGTRDFFAACFNLFSL